MGVDKTRVIVVPDSFQERKNKRGHLTFKKFFVIIYIER